jgi:Sec-independent protein translocase protein TatA
MAIELLFVLLLAYLLLGPKKSAGLAHRAGELFAQFNRVKADFKTKMEKELASLDSHSDTH